MSVDLFWSNLKAAKMLGLKFRKRILDNADYNNIGDCIEKTFSLQPIVGVLIPLEVESDIISLLLEWDYDNTKINLLPKGEWDMSNELNDLLKDTIEKCRMFDLPLILENV